MSATPAPASAQPRAEKFGTFLGVYTPSLLTILGLIMYLRFGWVLGNLGLGWTILIVLVASSITAATALSASAIATNMRVGVGGEYYMVSHSLGLEMGGAIGIPLYLSRTLSITFYCFGLSESILSLAPHSSALPEWTAQALTAGLIVVICGVSGHSAGLALKLQIPIMVAVGLSLVALVAGVFTGDLRAPEMVATYRTAPQGFWYVFAVFFPAVTGFTTGIGMSGDLEDPRASIPRGTLGAVLTGTAIYVTIPILLGITARVSLEELAEPGRVVWTSVALLGAWLVYPGVWGAILSSAFGSALGGPRVLQALASDGLVPRFLARTSRTGQPTVATLFSALIALGAVALGGLNTVAQFVTVLFLTLYVTINLSAALERLTGDPSYRPTIDAPWAVSLLGAAGAIAVMFLINAYACVAAIALELALYIHFRRRALRRHWGDVRAGFWTALVRFALLKLKSYSRDRDPRNWRPQILLFVDDPARRLGLVRMATWLNSDRGLVTACQLMVGDLEMQHVEIEQRRREMDEALDAEGLLAFTQVNVVPELERGVIDVTQASGLPGLETNTIMTGWPETPQHQATVMRLLRAMSNAGKSTVLVRLNWRHEPGHRKRIDLWWRGRERNGDLMLLLAYLLSHNPEWRSAAIHVHCIVESDDEARQVGASLASLIPEARIEAEAEVIVRGPGERITEIIVEHSGDADIVFLGLHDPEPGEEKAYAETLTNLSERLPTTVFVRNGSEFAGQLI